MGRHAQGWKLRKRPDGTYRVRFRLGGKRYEHTTGTGDLGEATRAAQQIYASALGAPSPVSVGRQFVEVGAEWLMTVAPDLKSADTLVLYEAYVARLAGFFATISSVTSNRVQDYRVRRLAQVTGDTCRRELMTLQRICRYAKKRGHLIELPEVELPRKKSGRRVTGARKVEFLLFADSELDAIVAALPEWSKPGQGKSTPIRARFAIARELGLRPATIDRLSVPEHYTPGSLELRVSDDVDKNDYGRPLLLSETARAALNAVLPTVGLIFGRHDYRYALRVAATEIGIDATRAAKISDYDFRHSLATNLGKRPDASLGGLMYVFGHKNPATTGRYLKPARDAADALLRAAFGGVSGAETKKPGTTKVRAKSKKSNDSK